MLLFTIVELVNKLLGLYITGYLARILPTSSLGHYLSGLVMLGYALELGFFGSQNRNNAEYAVHQAEYLDSQRFAARKTLTTLTSLLGALFLVLALRTSAEELDTTPLLLVLVCVPLMADFVAYGAGRTRVVVMARFVSQVLAFGWVTLVARGTISPTYLYWGQLWQTISATALISSAMVLLGRMRGAHFAIGIVRFPAKRAELATAIVDQSVAFALRLGVMAAVSSELMILNFLGNDLSSDVATSLRAVQVMFPFIVFYIDMRVRSVSDDGFLRYTVMIVAATLALVVGSPVLVRLLYGKAYMPMIADITAFAPALVVQATCQFQLMATLKAGTERSLVRRLLLVTCLSSGALAAIVATGGGLHQIVMLYTVKCFVVTMLLPTEQVRAKWLAASAVIVAATLNVVFVHVGYYDAITRLLP